MKRSFYSLLYTFLALGLLLITPACKHKAPARQKQSTTITHQLDHQLDNQLNNQKNINKKNKKKMVIFTSKGGAGHMSACKTLQAILSDEYEIKIINPLEELLASLDFVKKATLNNLDGEQFYNKLMQNGWMGTINNVLVPAGKKTIHWSRKKIERKFYNFLQREKPDILVSVIPFINFPASNAAKRCHIPFLSMTLDLDLSCWLLDMGMCTHPNYAITVVQKTPRIVAQLKENKIPDARVKEIGFHVRKDFSEPKDRAKICKDWSIPTNKPVIMILMGGVGTSQVIKYAKYLLTLDIPAHLLVCIGKNQPLANRLKKMKQTKNVSMTIVPFTTKISDLMFISDLFITKPGPNSCYEAVFYSLPTLIDGTGSCLFWELASIDLIKEHKLGEVIRRKKQIFPLVKKYLRWPHVAKTIDTNKAHQFDIAIKQVVHDLVKINNKTV